MESNLWLKLREREKEDGVGKVQSSLAEWIGQALLASQIISVQKPGMWEYYIRPTQIAA